MGPVAPLLRLSCAMGLREWGGNGAGVDVLRGDQGPLLWYRFEAAVCCALCKNNFRLLEEICEGC